MKHNESNPMVRVILMLVLFVLALALVLAGWKMTGQLAGLDHDRGCSAAAGCAVHYNNKYRTDPRSGPELDLKEQIIWLISKRPAA